MAVPFRVDDGDFTVEAQNGEVTITNALSDKGDFSHIEVRRKMRCAVNAYRSSLRTSLQRRTVTTTDGPVFVYLVGTTPAELFGTLQEWEEIYISIPAQRTEPTTISYTQQFILETTTSGSDSNTVTHSIEEFTNKRSGLTYFDYFLKTNPLPQIHAPRLEQVGNTIFSFSGWRNFLPDEEVVAEDSSVERFSGDVWVRKTPTIRWVPLLPVTNPTPTI